MRRNRHSGGRHLKGSIDLAATIHQRVSLATPNLSRILERLYLELKHEGDDWIICKVGSSEPLFSSKKSREVLDWLLQIYIPDLLATNSVPPPSPSPEKLASMARSKPDTLRIAFARIISSSSWSSCGSGDSFRARSHKETTKATTPRGQRTRFGMTLYRRGEPVFKTEQRSRHNGCTGALSLRDLVLSVRLQLVMIRRRRCVTRRLGLKHSHFLLGHLDRRRCGVRPVPVSQCIYVRNPFKG
jgi:hypothetical protein